VKGIKLPDTLRCALSFLLTCHCWFLHWRKYVNLL